MNESGARADWTAHAILDANDGWDRPSAP